MHIPFGHVEDGKRHVSVVDLHFGDFQGLLQDGALGEGGDAERQENQDAKNSFHVNGFLWINIQFFLNTGMSSRSTGTS